jgi:plasmid stability protein
MRQLTIRDIPDDLEKQIRKVARNRGKSINKTVRELLQEALGIGTQPEKRRDLSELAGVWDAEEAREFDRAIAVFEQVDEGLWG